MGTTLEFRIQDRVSKGWVWNAAMTLQNRTIRGFFQKDGGLRDYRFTHLKPGDWMLEVTAPSYEPVNIPVTLKSDQNSIEDPIQMTGLEIPGLSHFIVFEEFVGKDILCELRPVGIDGEAVLNHPCLDLWIGAKISVQISNGAPVQTETSKESSARGTELFSGKIEWEWNTLPETVFRYIARIDGSTIQDHAAPFRVIDYLIVVPNPKKINPEKLDNIVSEAWHEKDIKRLTTYLDGYSELFTYYIYTSWNVMEAG
jgi:hypothetical protein